jgi:hypothetical protein
MCEELLDDAVAHSPLRFIEDRIAGDDFSNLAMFIPFMAAIFRTNECQHDRQPWECDGNLLNRKSVRRGTSTVVLARAQDISKLDCWFIEGLRLGDQEREARLQHSAASSDCDAQLPLNNYFRKHRVKTTHPYFG